MKCYWRTCEKAVLTTGKRGPGKSRFCSKACKNKHHVVLRRRELKRLAIEYLGGACVQCGYTRCREALEFHHKDPSQKKFGIAERGFTRSLHVVKEELDKCFLLCANCHRELEVVERGSLWEKYDQEIETKINKLGGMLSRLAKNKLLH